METDTRTQRELYEFELGMPEELSGQLPMNRLEWLGKSERSDRKAIVGILGAVGSIGITEFLSVATDYQNLPKALAVFSLLSMGYAAYNIYRHNTRPPEDSD
jgi:hypothetical protein